MTIPEHKIRLSTREDPSYTPLELLPPELSLIMCTLERSTSLQKLISPQSLDRGPVYGNYANPTREYFLMHTAAPYPVLVPSTIIELEQRPYADLYYEQLGYTVAYNHNNGTLEISAKDAAPGNIDTLPIYTKRTRLNQGQPGKLSEPVRRLAMVILAGDANFLNEAATEGVIIVTKAATGKQNVTPVRPVLAIPKRKLPEKLTGMPSDNVPENTLFVVDLPLKYAAAQIANSGYLKRLDPALVVVQHVESS
jgi:hypothetical protein